MEILDIKKELAGNAYPGRGIVIGKSADGVHAVIAYFIMGRSVNSRNRVFVEQGDGIRTEAFDPAKLSDPDAPNFTPRISGLVKLKDGDFTYKLSILKSCEGNPDAPQSFFFDYTPVDGLGHFIHTYKCDGAPRIPSFEGEPKPVKIEGDIDTFTNDLWTNLNEDNKVSLFTRFINLKTGKIETRIVNKNK